MHTHAGTEIIYSGVIHIHRGRSTYNLYEYLNQNIEILIRLTEQRVPLHTFEMLLWSAPVARSASLTP